jgi:hypothetical protein
MRLLPAILFFWIVCSLFPGSENREGSFASVKELQSQVADMQSENQALRKQIRSRDSLSYAVTENRFLRLFNEAPRINFIFKHLG